MSTIWMLTFWRSVIRMPTKERSPWADLDSPAFGTLGVSLDGPNLLQPFRRCLQRGGSPRRFFHVRKFRVWNWLRTKEVFGIPIVERVNNIFLQ
jgi:hypothetical protein